MEPDATLIIITITKPKKPNMRPKFPDELYGYLGLIRPKITNLNLVRSFGWFWAENSNALAAPVK